MPDPLLPLQVFLTHAHLAIVMECAQGGDLFKFLMGQPGNRLPEEEARRIFQQLIIGLDYCHCQVILLKGCATAAC